MSLRSLASLAVLALALVGCDREAREPRGRPLPEGGPLMAAAVDPAKADPRAKDYMDNAYQVSQGQTYYRWMNCAGCHANGGGGMGPALMDQTWLYGGKPEEIFSTIVAGRPNGMPSFRERIPDFQIWQLAAYVRSMSGQLRKDAAPTRDDHMQGRPPESMTKQKSD